MVDPISAGAGAELAKKGTEEIVKRASKLIEVIKGKHNILEQDIVIYCPEKIQHFSIAFEATGGFLGRNKIKFPYGRPTRVKLRPLRSGNELSDAVNYTDDGFEIICDGMQGHDMFILEAEYPIEDSRFIDSLVQRDHAKELPKDSETEYWMHAAIKFPQALQTKAGRLDLRDVDFKVDVGISEDIKTSIPGSFRVELDAAVKLLKERDPHQKYVLGIQHAKAMRARGKGRNVAELLGELQDLFFPTGFSKYVEVKKDFRYSSCTRGVNYYDTLPFPTWPKSMIVISRTDLGPDRYAADGIMVYKKNDFLQRVGAILGIQVD